MVALKAHEVDRALSVAKTPPAAVCLVYGPDRGSVSERAAKIVSLSGVNVQDPFSYVRVQASELSGEASARLVEEVSTVSMFGGSRLVHLDASGADANLAGRVKSALSLLGTDTFLVIEAGDLKKGSALRSAIEQSKNAMAVPCYADDEKSLHNLIDQSVREAGKTITLDARQFLMSQLGGDRGTTRAELEKLLTYCADIDTIDYAHVAEIIGDTASIVVDSVIDGLLVGNLVQCEAGLSRMEASGAAPAILFSALSRQFQQIDLLRAMMDGQGKSARAIVESARPPVFYKRKAIVQEALGIWSPAMIGEAIERIHDTVLNSRKLAGLEASQIRIMILALGYKARLHKTRR